MEKAMLVHVGSICFEENESKASIKGYEPLTYWTLNTIVPNDQFINKHQRAACVVLTPLKKRIEKVISICAQEVMLCNPCQLGEGDIVLFQKNSRSDTYYTPEMLAALNAMRAQSQNIYFIDTNESPYQHGSRQFYKVSEIDLLKKLGVEVREDLKSLNDIPIDNASFQRNPLNYFQGVINEFLASRGKWLFKFDKPFWTHKTPFLKDNVKVLDQSAFFESILRKYPSISFGYEFYSQKGYASLFRILADLSKNSEAHKQHPEAYNLLCEFMKSALIESIQKDPLQRDPQEFGVQKVLAYEYPEKFEDEVDDEVESKPLDAFLLDVLLPLSPEIFHSFDAKHHHDKCLAHVWPYICKAYEITELYRRQDRLLSQLHSDKNELLRCLSKQAREKVFIAATGHDFITGDGRYIEGDESTVDNLHDSKIYDEEVVKAYLKQRKEIYFSRIDEWFSH